MILQSLRRFSSAATKMAEAATHAHAANPYGVRVAAAQQHVNGFVGGTMSYSFFYRRTLILTGLSYR